MYTKNDPHSVSTWKAVRTTTAAQSRIHNAIRNFGPRDQSVTNLEKPDTRQGILHNAAALNVGKATEKQCAVDALLYDRALAEARSSKHDLFTSLDIAVKSLLGEA